ncbi:hypothetical protein, partial [Mycoplasmopsis pullorum]|uniref:hypothetical protein n=1 Tax=Mycoplasmopsis pullorum TaxID=48003 RepID=UPI001C56A416
RDRYNYYDMQTKNTKLIKYLIAISLVSLFLLLIFTTIWIIEFQSLTITGDKIHYIENQDYGFNSSSQDLREVYVATIQKLKIWVSLIGASTGLAILSGASAVILKLTRK